MKIPLNGSASLSPVATLFIAILVTFVCTRLITRHIRSQETPGGAFSNVTIGGVHVHHQVFGIIFMLGAGLALIAATPEGAALHVTAAFFGVGVSLTFDEFALWLHLDDVYWTDDGRKSMDAMFCVLAISGLLIGGVDFITGDVGSVDWWASVIALLLTLLLALISVLKGKMVTGVIGVFFFPVSLVGAARLAKPKSVWSRRRYTHRPKKLRRAETRFDAAYEAKWNKLRDLVGGAPSR
ncbi:MAG: hypothetical protein M3Y19_09725 [Actinomycetota bacterium]|nr:hypothetical protein [Actinomycetota bacterium]